MLAQSKLTLGHGGAPGNPGHEAAVAFANAVKQKSGGKIEAQVATVRAILLRSGR